MEFASVFGYHRIVADNATANRYELKESIFKEHLELLTNRSLNALIFDDAVIDESLHLQKNLHNKIMLTFDDGYSSDYHRALPLLRQYGYKATFFITTNLLNNPGYLTTSEVRDLKAAGMSVQSHSYNHVMLPRLNNNDIYHELKRSKDDLEEIIQEKISQISLPGGQISESVIRLAHEVGYQCIFTSQPGYKIKKVGNVLIVKRFILLNNTPLYNFLAISDRNISIYLKEKSIYALKSLGKKLINKSVPRRLI